jgi:hypothetical protein
MRPLQTAARECIIEVYRRVTRRPTLPAIHRAARLTRRPASGPGWPFPSPARCAALPPAWVALLVLAACLARPAAAAGPVELVSSDERGVTLRLTIERYDLAPPGEDGRREILIPRLDLLDVPGRPKLPFATALVALPPGAGASVTVIDDGAEEVVDGVRLTIGDRAVVRAEPDGLGYAAVRDPVAPILDGAWPASTAEAGEPFTLRRQRVAVVQLQPFRYDAATERLWTRRTLTVRVNFTGVSSAPSTAAAPGEDRGWEPVLKSTLVNYDQGRRWREPRPALGRGLFDRHGLRVGPAGAQAAAAFDETEPEVRVRIAATGVWALDATELLAKDYPTGVPIAEVSVHRHEFLPSVLAPNPPYATYEIPIEVEDADGDGFFTAGDRIVLYAQSWWERSGLAYRTPISHSQHNWGEADYVYATRVLSPRQGLRILTRGGWIGITLPILNSYPYRQRWEQNTSYNSAPKDTTQDPYMWITRPNYYRRSELPFTTYDLDTTLAVSVGATWTGLLASYDHFVWFSVKNALGQVTSVVDSARATGKVTVTRRNSIFGSALSEGANNRFVIWGKRLDAPPHASTNAFPDVALEYFETSYNRRYKAIQGMLPCNSGSFAGDYEIFATGFTDSAALRVYDVTDSSAIRRLVATPKEAVAGGFGVRFQDNAPAGVQRRYLVLDTPRAPAPADYGRVDAVAVRNLYDRTAGDYLLIVPEAFVSAMDPLVTLRRSQGLDVVLAPLEEVNDVFNGGRKSPWAIRRFVRHAYDNWDARFVLLVGDGSEDPQQTAGYYTNGDPISSPDLVPTQRVLSSVPAAGPEEVFFQAIVSDTWYVWCVDCPDPFHSKAKVPDLHIGRLPVQTLAAATAVVTKLVNYETVTADQTWRRKMVLLSDDQYSGNIFGVIDLTSTYCRSGQESVFRTINDRCRSIILDEAGLGQSEPEVLNMSYYLPNSPADLTPCSQFPDTCRCRGTDFITRCRATAQPALFTRLAEGRLWWNFQGHANETVLSHEAIYANGFNNLPDDKDALQNYGKPFLFSAFSCHPNAFAHYRENRAPPGGPSLGEEMVVLADRGAIASWASTGFESLPTSSTRHVNVTFARALFSDPPREPQAFDPVGGARVVLGEVISKAVIDYWPGPGSSSERDVMISYNLLGDPATRVTVGSPQAVFRANGVPVTDGVPVRLFTIGDSLRIEGDLVSNARIDTAWVERIEGSNPPVATALTDSLTPAFPDTTDASGGGRRYHVVYRTHLTAGTYTYRFRTVDRYGTPGRFDAAFRFETQFSAEGGVIRDGDVVGPNAAFSYLVLSPAPLNDPVNELALFLNGQRLTFVATPYNNDQSKREWVLTWTHGPYPDGNYRLDLDVMGVRAATHTFQVKSQFAMQNPLAFPNPFNDERGTVFSFYLESDRPSKVMLRVYTISGRVIYERVLSGVPTGYQQIQWNGKDAEGGSLANGVYFYRLVADNGSSSTRYEGRLVKLTKPHNVTEEQAP